MQRIDLSIIILSYKSKGHLEVLLPSVFDSEGIKFVVSPFMGKECKDESVANPFMGNKRNKSDEGADKSARYIDNDQTADINVLAGNRSARYTAEIIIVDNASNDGTVEWLDNYQEHDLRGRVNRAKEHNFILIKSVYNLGFSKGNNLGIRQAKGKYILLLNPDTKLKPDTLKVMIEFMENRPDVGISGCKLVKLNGKLDLACRRRFPNPWNSLKRLFLKDNSNYNYTDINEDKSMEVDSVVGAFMMIRRSTIDKIGLLDENFFMYGEDLDWCWRCKEVGEKVWYYPKTFIVHYKGESSRRVALKALLWFHRAMWIFYRKHYKQEYPFILNWLVWLGIHFRLAILVIINFFKKEKRVSR